MVNNCCPNLIWNLSSILSSCCCSSSTMHTNSSSSGPSAMASYSPSVPMASLIHACKYQYRGGIFCRGMRIDCWLKSCANKFHTGALEIHNYASTFYQLWIDVFLLFNTVNPMEFGMRWDLWWLFWQRVWKMCETNEKVLRHLKEKTSAVLRMWWWRSSGSQFHWACLSKWEKL